MNPIPESHRRVRKRKNPVTKANPKSKEKAKPKSRGTDSSSCTSTGLPEGRIFQFNEFIDNHQQRLKHVTQAQVWLTIWRHGYPHNRAKISQGRIAKSIGKSARRVRDIIRELEELGYLKVLEQGGLGNRVNVYQLRFPAYEEETHDR